MLNLMQSNDEFIGTKEAAELRGIDRTGIIRRVASGELVPVQKLPGKSGSYIFRRSDIEASLSEAHSS